MMKEREAERQRAAQSGGNGHAATPPVLARDLILKELERVLASSQFCNSTSMSRFLRFVVEETLDGRGESLKEFVIGVHVYNRGAAFDPRTDPIVRVQANKIRKRLAAYYADRDATTPVQIEIPKGSYVPVFRQHATPKPGRRRRLRLIITAFAAVSATATLLSWCIPTVHRSVNAPTPWQLTFDTGWNSHPAVSRDGSLVAFASDRPDGSNVDIWISDWRGGQLRRLTTHPAIDWTPDFSPDGRRIVFRSFRAGGGIYSIPVEGGSETLVAPGGFSPRYSPDGRWIAFTAMEAGNSRLYVVPEEGGASRRLVEQDLTSDCPVWTPDGRGLLFKQSESDTKHDWWFVPFDVGVRTPAPARRIGFQEALAKINGIGATVWTCPGGWLGHEMFFSNNDQLYRVPFSGRDWTAQSGGALVLAGPGIDSVRTAVQPGGHSAVVFAQGETAEDFWAVPIRPGAHAGGELLQVTSGAYVQAALYSSSISISQDGRFLAFATHNAALGHRILFRDLQIQTERPLSPASQSPAAPVMTPDGRSIAWVVNKDEKGTIFTGGTDGGGVREFCSGCGIPRAWSPNGAILLYTDGPDLWSVTFPNGSRRLLFKKPGYEVEDAGFSPDGSWVAMVVAVEGRAKVQGVLAPFDRISDEKQWVPIVEEDYYLALKWAAEGDMVYYLSRRDDFRCLYGQPLRPSDKRPLGPPIAVRHFHSYRNYPNAGSPIAVALDKVVLRLTTRKSNIRAFAMVNPAP